VFPFLIASESLLVDQDVTVAAGERDGAFFVAGWSRPLTQGAVTTRTSEGDRSVMRLPLPAVADYDLTLRLDPFPRPAADAAERLPAVRVLVNDRIAATFDLRWDPERVGVYEVHVPEIMTKSGVNRLVLLRDAKPGGPDRVSLWHVRIRAAKR
jgi:hypothetical protein